MLVEQVNVNASFSTYFPYPRSSKCFFRASRSGEANVQSKQTEVNYGWLFLERSLLYIWFLWSECLNHWTLKSLIDSSRSRCYGAPCVPSAPCSLPPGSPAPPTRESPDSGRCTPPRQRRRRSSRITWTWGESCYKPWLTQRPELHESTCNLVMQNGCIEQGCMGYGQFVSHSTCKVQICT